MQAKHGLHNRRSFSAIYKEAVQKCQKARQLASHDPVASWHLQDLHLILQSMLQSAEGSVTGCAPVATSGPPSVPRHDSNHDERRADPEPLKSRSRLARKANQREQPSPARSPDQDHHHQDRLPRAATGCYLDSGVIPPMAQQLTCQSSCQCSHHTQRAASLLLQHSQAKEQTWRDLTATAVQHSSDTTQQYSECARTTLWGLRPLLQHTVTHASPQNDAPKAESLPRNKRMQDMSATNARAAFKETSVANVLATAAAATAGGSKGRNVRPGKLQTCQDSKINRGLPCSCTDSGASEARPEDDGQQQRLAGLLEAYLLSWSSPGIHRQGPKKTLLFLKRLPVEPAQDRLITAAAWCMLSLAWASTRGLQPPLKDWSFKRMLCHHESFWYPLAFIRAP